MSGCGPWTVTDSGGILADDMGIGKNHTDLLPLLEDAYSSGEQSPSLITCPASLVYNWERRIRRFAPDLKSIIRGGKQFGAGRVPLNEGGKKSLGLSGYVTSILRFAEKEM